MAVLKERMYSKSVFARQFHLGWLNALRAVPDSQLLKYLPGILDQLFIILSDDTKEIRTRYKIRQLEIKTLEFQPALIKTQPLQSTRHLSLL